jgi:tetratricopeptide (TPR) repeat protein
MLRSKLRHPGFGLLLISLGLYLAAQPMSSGESEFTAGNFLKAKGIFIASAERLGSTGGTTLGQLHDAYLRQLETEVLTGDYGTASNTAQRMLSKVSTSPEQQAQVSLLQGRIAIERGEYDAALGFLERAASTVPALARASAAELLRRQEKFPEAERAFDDAAAMLARDGRPATAEVLLGQAEIQLALGKYSDAQRTIEAVRKSWKFPPTHPETARLRNLAAFAAYRLGDLELAAKESSGNAQQVEAAAGSLHPGYAESLLMDALVSHARRDERQAQMAFDKVSKVWAALPDRSPRKTRLLLALGAYAFDRGEVTAAQKQILEAHRLRKAHSGEDSLAAAEAEIMLALLEIQANRYALAETYLKHGLSVFDTLQVGALQEYRLAADFAMGAVLHQQKDYVESKKRLTRWIAASKPASEHGSAKARELVGGILLNEGQAAEAAKLLKEALDIDIQLKRSGAATARTTLLLAKARSKAGDLPGAVSMFESILGREDSAKAIEPLELAEAHRMLGDVYTKMRLASNAASSYQAALKISEGRIPPSDPLFLGTLASAAGAMLEAKRGAEAMPLLSRLLTLRDQSQDKYSPDSISIVSKLADLYFDNGRLAQAAPLYERLIDATAKGKTIGDRKNLLERVGDTYARTGRREESARAYDQRARLALDRHAYDEAETFAKKIQSMLNTSPAHASQRAGALNILGDIRVAQNKREEAEQYYREAVGLASGNPLIEASSLNGLGRLALKQKDLPGAKTQLERALSLVTGASAGANRGLEAMVVANLAALNAVAGDSAASLELYSKFLQIEASTTVDDPPLVEYLDEAANLYARTPGKSEEIEDLYRRGLNASSRAFGNSSRETAFSHFNLAEFYSFRKIYPKALESYREALQVFEGLKGPESDEAVTVLTGIASTQAKAGDFDAAITSYGSLLAMAEKSPSDKARKVTAALNAMAFVYRQANRHADAREAFQKVVALWGAQGAAEPAWVAASRNAGISMIDEGSFKEGSANLTALRTTVRRAAGNRDSAAEIEILRSMGQALKRQNRNKEADEAIRQADQAEKRLAAAKK